MSGLRPPDARNAEELRHSLTEGHEASFIHFWNPEPHDAAGHMDADADHLHDDPSHPHDAAAPRLPFKPASRPLDKNCLSQWWPATFEVDRIQFASAEHYMMWRKAVLFEDHTIAKQILAAPHPEEAKRLGRAVRGFNRDVWVQHRWDVVVDGSLAKFTSDPALAHYLRSTESRVLVEASPVDTIWGIGFAEDHPAASDPFQWRGLNLLGFALMEARSRLL